MEQTTQATTTPNNDQESRQTEPVDFGGFFSQNKADIDEFVNQMKQPREEITAPPFQFNEEEDNELPGESDEEMAGHLNFGEGERMTAEFILKTTDGLFAFMFSMWSKEEAERYLAFKKESQQTKQVVELGAALVKKYQAKLSLEFMFFTALGMLYVPMAAKAEQDRVARVNRQRAQAEEERIRKAVKFAKEDAETQGR